MQNLMWINNRVDFSTFTNIKKIKKCIYAQPAGMFQELLGSSRKEIAHRKSGPARIPGFLRVLPDKVDRSVTLHQWTTTCDVLMFQIYI